MEHQLPSASVYQKKGVRDRSQGTAWRNSRFGVKTKLMRVLYHLWLSPASRLARLLLAEKKMRFELKAEKTWERRSAFLRLSPAGEVPVLVDREGLVLVGVHAIAGHLEDLRAPPSLLGESPQQRAETRRLIDWFMIKFEREVAGPILAELVMKRYTRTGAPSPLVLRSARRNLHHHLAYLMHLLKQQPHLTGETRTAADLGAAAALSVLDYLDEVNWSEVARAKEWYRRLKSRPAFRGLLKDNLVGLPPPTHYTTLDF